MNDAQRLVLRDELLTDPLARGYSGMTDAQAAASLNTANRTRQKTHLTGAQIYECMDRTEFEAKTDPQKVYVRDILGLGGDILVTSGSKTRSVFVAVFGAGSATINALVALVTETISRATEVGLPVVKPGHVSEARA